MPKRLPVIAVIPNYNMAKSLDKLLAQVIKAGYDAIYVLDDSSTDSSLEVASKYKDVKVIKIRRNGGPAATRNRIIPEVKNDCILHFLDADVSLISKNNPDICRKLFEAENRLGLVGGLIITPDKKPMVFNYGPAFSLYASIGGLFHALVYLQGKYKPRLARYTHWWRKEYPDPNERPSAKKVFWVAEGNMIIPSKILKEVNGFDERLRFHEAQDLSIKLYRKGYYVEFSPEPSVLHPELILASKNKRKTMNKASIQLVKKYGLHFKNI